VRLLYTGTLSSITSDYQRHHHSITEGVLAAGAQRSCERIIPQSLPSPQVLPGSMLAVSYPPV
jgi:hypothetical protein